MEEENTRSRGTVVRFDDQKGYGFIKPDDGGEDLFVHHSSIKSDGFRSLQQGQSVEFSIALEGDQTKAVDVSALGGTPPRRTSRSGGEGCYSCGQEGHIARDCPSGGGGFSRGGECYNCGMTGHIARECRGGERVERGGGEGCYNCGMKGHIARECRGERGERGGDGCYNCGGFGHIARECPSGRAGGRFGGGGGGGCYSCGEAGHFARECTNKA